MAGTLLAPCVLRPTERILPIQGSGGEWAAVVRVFESQMSETPPIACTLSASDLQNREGAWQKLIASGLLEREPVPGGIRLHAAPGAGAALMALIDLERDCCAWIRFDVAGASTVTLTAEGDGEAVLVGMFGEPPN